ncbi:MAG: peptidase M23 [Anderseniella sp.]|jgi:hypothetical protein|nr:peptidase M23 [Anderseniella sp.]
MTRLMIAAAASLFATPALAHDGAHLHPHGTELVWSLLAMGLAAACAVWLVKGRGR